MMPLHLSRAQGSKGPIAIRSVLPIALAMTTTLSLRGDSAAPKIKFPQLEKPKSETYPSPALPEEPVKRAVFERINRDRVAAGLSPVAWDEAASQVADDFCARQVAEKTRGHFLTDGIPPYARMAFGGAFGMQSENSISWVTSASSFSEPVVRLALEGHEEMLREKPPNDGHRKTILDPDATHVGVGWACAEGRFQMAQEFLVRGLARLSLSTSRGGIGVFFEGKPLGTTNLSFVIVSREPTPRALSRAEASGRTSYAYPEASLSYIPEGFRLMHVAGTTSDDRLKIRADRSFSFEFVPVRPGLYTFVFYVSPHIGSSPRPAGSASLWFE